MSARRSDGTFATSHLDAASPLSLAEARERLVALRDGRHAPRPRDRLAIDAVLGLLDAVERRLQQLGENSPAAGGPGREG